MASSRLDMLCIDIISETFWKTLSRGFSGDQEAQWSSASWLGRVYELFALDNQYTLA